MMVEGCRGVEYGGVAVRVGGEGRHGGSRWTNYMHLHSPAQLGSLVPSPHLHATAAHRDAGHLTAPLPHIHNNTQNGMQQSIACGPSVCMLHVSRVCVCCMRPSVCVCALHVSRVCVCVLHVSRVCVSCTKHASPSSPDKHATPSSPDKHLDVVCYSGCSGAQLLRRMSSCPCSGPGVHPLHRL